MPVPFAVAAGVGAVGSIATGLIGANAAGKAANAQEQAAQLASNTELQMFNQQQADLAPYQAGGVNSLAALQKLLGIGPGGAGASSPILAMLGIGANGQPTGGGINPATFQGSPGYQFQKQQGLNAVTNSAAANGGLGGNALKALTSYGSGIANQDWYNYLGATNSAYQGLVGNVAGLTNLGENAAAGAGAGALATGSQVGANQIGAGNAAASGIIGSASALGGAVNGVGQNALLYALMNSQNSGGGTGIGTGLGNLFSGSNWSGTAPIGYSANEYWGGGGSP